MILMDTRAVIASVSGAPGRLKIDLEQDLCFTAGLIHDSGKRGMAIYHLETLKEIMKVPGKNKWTLDRGSKETLGFSLSDITVELAMA